MARGVSVGGIQFRAMGERGEGEEPLLPRKMTGWSTAQEILGLWVDTEDITVVLPQKKL